MKTKIAYIIPTLGAAGAEKQQINILNGIDDKNYEIKLYVLKNNTQLLPQLKNQNVAVEICNINSFRSIGAMYGFLKSIKDYKPDIIHSQMYNANILSRFLKLFLLPKSKVVNHYHGMSKWMTKTKLILDKLTSSLVDRFIVVSKRSFDLRISREGYPKDKMVLLYNSVDIQPPREMLKQNKILTIGMASRLIPLKNIEGALYMLAELLKKGLKFRLVIAGDGPHKKYLQEYAKELGVTDHVEFFGFISDMEKFYSQIDIFCISSLTEDLPLSMIEAMMMGKSVIASNVGGIPDILKDVLCSILVDDFFDKNDINKIELFLKDLDQNKCRSELMEYAMDHFDNQSYCMRLTKMYNELLVD